VALFLLLEQHVSDIGEAHDPSFADDGDTSPAKLGRRKILTS